METRICDYVLHSTVCREAKISMTLAVYRQSIINKINVFTKNVLEVFLLSYRLTTKKRLCFEGRAFCDVPSSEF